MLTPTIIAVMMTCSAGLQHQQQKQRSLNILKEAKAKVEKRRRSYAGSLDMQLDASQPILLAYLLITPTSILVAVMMTCSAGLQHQQQKQRSFNIFKEAKAKVEKRRRSYAGSLEMQLDASQPILSAYLLITPTSILVAVMMTCSAGLQHQQQKQRSFNILKEAKAKVEKRRRSYAGSLEMQLDASQPFVLLLLVGFRYVFNTCSRGTSRTALASLETIANIGMLCFGGEKWLQTTGVLAVYHYTSHTTYTLAV